MLRITAALLALVYLAGCIPVRWQDAPATSGQVIDAVSSQPIVGASSANGWEVRGPNGKANEPSF